MREQDGSTEDAEMRRATRSIQPIAVEVELTDKSARRLDQLMRAWRRSVAREQFGCVRYLCGPRALPYVERAAARTRTAELIEIEPLDGGDGILGLAARRSPFSPEGSGAVATSPLSPFGQRQPVAAASPF
jgi:hypothetical protein